MYEQIRELRIEVLELIEVNRRSGQMRRLHLAAARLCGLQAHVCLDLGRYDLAGTNARSARIMAELAGHADTLAWTYALHSLIAYWDGRLSEAIDVAEEGLIHASEAVRVRLYGLKARAAAAMRQRCTALEAVAAADEVCTDPLQKHGIFKFPAAKWHVYAATTLSTLGGRDLATRAIAHAEQAIRLYRAADPLDQSTGDLLAARFELAAAHVADWDLHSARQQLTPIFEAPQANRTASIVKRATRLQHIISTDGLSRTTLARSLHDELRAFCKYPAQITVTEPPQ